MLEDSDIPLQALDEPSLKFKLNQETARISWRDLQTVFAAGRVLWVSDKLDLIEVAYRMIRDDKPAFEKWTTAEELNPVSDPQAQEWIAGDRDLWAIVIKPWVLVQENKPENVSPG